MIRRLLIMFFCCMGLTVAGIDAQAKDIRVLATTFPVAQFTRNVCKNVPGVTVQLLIPSSVGCPHDFALKPADVRKFAEANFLVINGGGLESFLPRMLENTPTDLQLIDAGEDLPMLPEQGHPGHFNPHVFAAPSDASLMVANIARRMALLDPEHAALYQDNANSYRGALYELSQSLENVGKAAGGRSVALEHDALAYLMANAGLPVQSYIDPSATAVQLAALIKEFKSSSPALLIGDSQYPDRTAATISRETGIPFIKLDSGASGPEDAPDDYYLKIMANNIEILKKSLPAG